MKYVGVSFRCPFCLMSCGWDEKKKVFDGVQVPHPEKEDWRQYAHNECAEKGASRRR